MTTIIHPIRLSIDPGTGSGRSRPMARLTQNDSNIHILSVSVRNIDTSAFLEKHLIVVRPDGAAYQKEASSDSDEALRFPLAGDIIALPGSYTCVVQLYGKDSRLTSQMFTYEVARDLSDVPDLLPSEEQLTILTRLIGDTHAVIERADTISETLEQKLAAGYFKGERGEKGERGDMPDTSDFANAVIGSRAANASHISLSDLQPNASIRNLIIHGKSVQDGVPSPDAPIPIRSLGDSGSFDVRVGDVTRTIHLTDPLRSLPNGTADYIDWSRGKVVWRVGRIVLDGTVIPNIAGVSSGSPGFYYITYNSFDSLISDNPINIVQFFCDKIEVFNSAIAASSTLSREILANTHEFGGATRLRFFIRQDRLNQFSGTVNQRWNNWVSQNPVTIYYQRATITEEDITLPTLHSVDGTTVVSVLDPVGASRMEVTYNRDLNTVIQELTTAIIGLGGVL